MERKTLKYLPVIYCFRNEMNAFKVKGTLKICDVRFLTCGLN